MAESNLRKAIQNKLSISSRTLYRQVQKTKDELGPLTTEEACWVIAQQAHIDLVQFGLSDEQRARVRSLRLVGRAPAELPRAAGDDRKRPFGTQAVTPTLAERIDAAALHPAVLKVSRKLYLNRHFVDAVRKAFANVLSRVKRMSRLPQEGRTLMGDAFGDGAHIRLSDLKTQSEKDEQEGLRFLMMGGVCAIRNPCSHEDSWPFFEDQNRALHALAFASLLHEYLDSCESFAASRKALGAP